MKKITFLLLLIIMCSCKQKEKPYYMYGILNQEFAHSIEILKVQIAKNITNENLINNISAKEYDRLTKEYLKYLDKIDMELINNPKIEKPTSYNGELSKKEYINDLFFEGEEYNEKATEFISKLEKYRNGILKLIKDEDLAKRVDRIFDTMNIQNQQGKEIKYLNYLYQDMPLISVLAHMRNREKSILEFENEFLSNIQLNE